jgi:hypothetical protein
MDATLIILAVMIIGFVLVTAMSQLLNKGSIE